MSPQEEQPRSAVAVIVGAEEHGQRIDNFLLCRLKGVPKSRVYRILRRGEVRVNSGRIGPSYRLQTGDRVRIPPLRLAQEKPLPRVSHHLQSTLADTVLYEDERILAVDKPAGVAVHGGSGVSLGVIEALRQLRPDLPHLELVHRLDRETSGCLLLSKRRSALRALHELMRSGEVDKRYLALLAGRWERTRIAVDAPLLKNTLQSGERMVRVSAAGKAARTVFRRIEVFADATLVEAQLLTGRTHQIRVHAAHLGTPILGDDKYGDTHANAAAKKRGLRRLFLHARALGFRWPESTQPIHVTAPLPRELQRLLDKYRSTT